jgi:anti-anti-sigma factor
MFHADDQHVIMTGQVVETEEEAYLNDGIHEYLTVKFPIYNSEGVIYAIGGICTDITERKRAEEERATFHEQIIDAQRSALSELSTPLLPLTDKVVALPLNGIVDTTRAQQMMTTLLEGVTQHKAKFVIIDITGVSVVDTQVARAMVQTAQAVKLLGARVVLTGIHPQIAQTLVEMGADLSGVVTRSTLQAGVAYVLGGEFRVCSRK